LQPATAKNQTTSTKPACRQAGSKQGPKSKAPKLKRDSLTVLLLGFFLLFEIFCLSFWSLFGPWCLLFGAYLQLGTLGARHKTPADEVP
jgi:hypothetical protein